MHNHATKSTLSNRQATTPLSPKKIFGAN